LLKLVSRVRGSPTAHCAAILLGGSEWIGFQARAAQTWTENRQYQQSSWTLQASTTGKSARRFTFAVWKGADLEIPFLKQARAKYAKFAVGA
jgi:hypothetical protein